MWDGPDRFSVSKSFPLNQKTKQQNKAKNGIYFCWVNYGWVLRFSFRLFLVFICREQMHSLGNNVLFQPISARIASLAPFSHSMLFEWGRHRRERREHTNARINLGKSASATVLHARGSSTLQFGHGAARDSNYYYYYCYRCCCCCTWDGRFYCYC